MSLKLKKLQSFSGRKGPLLLIIMDGIGIGPEDEGNAVYQAKTPNLDRLFSSRFYCRLQAHGTAVGLPTDKDMGNSEVGHNALGAGKVFDQGALLVNRAIESGLIFKTKLWAEIAERVKQGATLHFIGLLSDGYVHSHIGQLNGMIDKCVELGFRRVRLHILLDGRDVGEKSALDYIIPAEKKLAGISKEKGMDYSIASGGGRMKVTMDRYNADWDVVKRGWEAHVHGKGRKFRSAEEAVSTFYHEDPNITDQYMDAFVIVGPEERPVGTIVDGDAVICFNFRGDRAIEISRAFIEHDLHEFDRGPLPDVLYAGMMEYDGDTHIPANFLVQPPSIDHTLSEYLCAERIKSFAVSETQKYGHVTYFWNGNRSGYIDEALETYVEIPSDKLKFDTAPKMQALKIKDKAIAMLKSGEYGFGRLNFANGDMVGHTGVMEAAVTAVETVDYCVGELLDVIKQLDGIAVVTSDHGNSEGMFTVDKNGDRIVKTSHTLNPVPFVIYDPGYAGEYEMADPDRRGLANVAATILNLLGYMKVDDCVPSLIKIREA
ncbi:MAG: 2,3-bisphosphoglycerate-independent phosphoglycerate mutase [Desulfobacterales bacterium]|nr:2,3-bisphosphoglycerate-independent phosphoglycerate mutase [Desulfobacterales bacterium]